MNNTRNRSLLCGGMILLECILWGIGNPMIKLMEGVIPNFLLLALRFAISFVLMMAVFGRRIIPALRQAKLRPIFIASVYTAAAYILSNFGLRLATATAAGFLMGLSVLFTPILAFLFYRQKMHAAQWIPIVIVMAGMYLMCGVEGGFGFGIGEALALLSSAASALMLVSSARVLEETDAMAVSAVQFAVTALCCFICALLFEDVTVLARVPASGWWILAYLAIGTSFFAFILQNVGLTGVSSMYASLLMCSEPLFTAVAAYFMLGERLTLPGFIGAGLIMVSLILATLLTEKPDLLTRQKVVR